MHIKIKTFETCFYLEIHILLLSSNKFALLLHSMPVIWHVVILHVIFLHMLTRHAVFLHIPKIRTLPSIQPPRFRGRICMRFLMIFQMMPSLKPFSAHGACKFPNRLVHTLIMTLQLGQRAEHFPAKGALVRLV